MRIEEGAIKRPVYICETCGRKSNLKFTIHNCERKHLRPTCKHTEFKYKAHLDMDYDNEPELTFEKTCTVCDTQLIEKTISEDDFTPEIIEMMIGDLTE